MITCVLTANVVCASGNPATSNPITMVVNPVAAVSVTIAANPGISICPSTSVTFTATPVNGGTTPVYQWKKNGVNVGSNSPTYTDAGLTGGELITCVLTSNAPCATGSPATSNSLTITVNSPALFTVRSNLNNGATSLMVIDSIVITMNHIGVRIGMASIDASTTYTLYKMEYLLHLL